MNALGASAKAASNLGCLVGTTINKGSMLVLAANSLNEAKKNFNDGDYLETAHVVCTR
ncbi:MAG: hypothetical protein LBJ67_14615 [Planctomycetaceae bacterium]|nr:hypothetical protein [Planctomycetaceae bacterium]